MAPAATLFLSTQVYVTCWCLHVSYAASAFATITQCYTHPQGRYYSEVGWTLEDSDGATAASVRPKACLAQTQSWRIHSISCLLSNQGGADDVTYGGMCSPTSAPTTSAPTTPVPDMGNVSTFSALSACCQFDNADITVTGDITFTDQLTITGRTVSITSTTDAVLTSDRSFSANTGGMLFIDDGADVTLTGLHFVSGSASLYGGCLGVDSSDLAVFNSSFTSCSSSVGRKSVYWCRSRQ